MDQRQSKRAVSASITAYNESVRFIVPVIFLLAVSCSNPAPQQPKSGKAVAPVTHEPPHDLSTKFPAEGQTGMTLVPDHLLGKEFMPGGNLATYKTAAGQYQMFLLEAPDANKAAYVLVDWKEAFPNAKYLAHMGGYMATDNGKPIYIFAKGPYVAGIIGLAEEKADVEARRFAARL